MKRMTFTASMILACNLACWGQACYQATGQTVAFTVQAGAKSGPAAIREITPMRCEIKSGISITATGGFILITMPKIERGSGDIAVYDIAGRQIYGQRGFNGTALHLETHKFAAGIYTARIHVDGQNYLRRLIISN